MVFPRRTVSIIGDDDKISNGFGLHDPRNLKQDEIEEILIHQCSVLANVLVVDPLFLHALIGVRTRSEVSKLGLKDIEDSLR